MKQDQIWIIKLANLEIKGGPTETTAYNEMEKELNDQKVEQNDTTMMIESTGTIALRTIPVYIYI